MTTSDDIVYSLVGVVLAEDEFDLIVGVADITEGVAVLAGTSASDGKRNYLLLQ